MLIKGFLCSVTPKAFPLATPLSESNFEDNKGKAEPVSHKLPKFNGDKTKFENVWVTFESILDQKG